LNDDIAFATLTGVFIKFGANVDMFLVSLSGALYGSVVYVLKVTCRVFKCQ